MFDTVETLDRTIDSVYRKHVFLHALDGVLIFPPHFLVWYRFGFGFYFFQVCSFGDGVTVVVVIVVVIFVAGDGGGSA